MPRIAVLRDACLGDFDTIVKYNLEMAAETENVQLPPDVAARGVAAVLNGQAAARYFVADVAGQVQAQLMVTYEWSDWRACNIWWIQSVYCHPDHRQQGLFKQLYAHVKAAAQKEGAAGLRLYCDLQNTQAQAAYERVGMTCHYKVYEEMTTSY